MQDPILLIEILSPSTERHDRRIKLPAYRQIASVQEFLLLASNERYAELHRRQGSMAHRADQRRRDAALASVGIEISMSELYEGFVFEDEAGASRHMIQRLYARILDIAAGPHALGRCWSSRLPRARFSRSRPTSC